jgi:hypothetical protein
MSDQEFDIFKELGMENLPEDQKEALREQMLDLIETRFNRAILMAMPEDYKLEFDKILESGEGVEEFIQAKVPNYADIHREIVDDLKNEMLSMQDKVFKPSV